MVALPRAVAIVRPLSFTRDGSALRFVMRSSSAASRDNTTPHGTSRRQSAEPVVEAHAPHHSSASRSGPERNGVSSADHPGWLTLQLTAMRGGKGSQRPSAFRLFSVPESRKKATNIGNPTSRRLRRNQESKLPHPSTETSSPSVPASPVRAASRANIPPLLDLPTTFQTRSTDKTPPLLIPSHSIVRLPSTPETPARNAEVIAYPSATLTPKQWSNIAPQRP
ncbi:hypothetical protein V500_10872 [Pseudogymnoascus sp. VKM F-4518 (FW-2643)]|nr:hypothetical protein V500_10872 [Pseudogymnoascus sp. VKM F-4518 (FW-2643)]